MTGRDPARARAGRFVAADRHDAGELGRAFGGGADLLVDCIAYTAADARLLLPFVRDVASTVMISSKAVYADADGRHSNSDTSPDFCGPVRETQSTVPPREDIPFDSREGYGANKAAAEQVLLESGAPVTVLRPSKINGEGASPPREWLYVKRVLDRRPVVFLAHRGEGVDHPTASANIAALVEVVAAKPGTRILNSADPDAPNALEISRAVARHLGHEWEEVLVDDASLGANPWDKRPPFVLDMTAAAALGYQPVGDYTTTVAEEIDWLVRERPPIDGFDGAFDYAAEDEALRRRTT